MGAGGSVERLRARESGGAWFPLVGRRTVGCLYYLYSRLYSPHNSRNLEVAALKSLLIIAVLVVSGLVFPWPSPLSAQENPSISTAPKVTKEQIKDLVGKPDFYLLDVRPNEQWRATEVKLPGAVHEDPEDVEGWAEKYPKSARIVTYCA
jgi:hypothetical protein